LRTPLDSKLVQTARTTPVWIVASPEVIEDVGGPFTDAGVLLLAADETPQGDLDMMSVLKVLAGQGMTRVLVECGPRLAATFVKVDLVDRLAWFRAPVTLGGDALTAFDSLGVAKVMNAKRFALVETLRLGEDVLETYCRTSY
ncbi:MAG: RibD family protein, partial [Proteobacteria bacterium]|nr:RibD family protein [Pseudomonadota bacterium]